MYIEDSYANIPLVSYFRQNAYASNIIWAKYKIMRCTKSIDFLQKTEIENQFQLFRFFYYTRQNYIHVLNVYK